jgi:thymidylate kinase
LAYMSDNLDVLVAESDGPRAREVLLGLRYVELRNVEEPHKFLFRKFHLAESVSAIHLHEFVGWGTGFMEDAAVLARSRPSPDDPVVRIPSPEDALMITMAHAFYEDKAIKLGDLWKVIHVLRHHDLEWDLITRQATERGWRAGLDTCIWLWSALEASLYGQHSFPAEIVARAREQAPAWCRAYLEQRLAAEPRYPVGVSFRFSKRHYYGKVLADRAIAAPQKALDIWRHSWAGVERRLPCKLQPAMLVTLSGVDGCGKSTQALALQRAMATCDIVSTVVWSRGGSSRLSDAVIALIKPLLARRTTLDTHSDTREAKTARKRAWLKRPLLRRGWIALNVVDLTLHYWAQVAWPMMRGRVIIADRYTFDALVELAVLTERPAVLEGLGARMLRWLCPRPHLAYYMDVSPEAAHQRKPDEPVAYLERQRALYSRAAHLWNLRTVAADGDLEQIMDPLVHEVLIAYYRRVRTAVKQ